ncbi:MAG TPA: ABC transporter permease [Gemmatimonadaceae bacterium]|nr:ABC transporter permease [Gemmatimonadaceae bacterium]
MLIGETLRVALASLRANKLRSFLTMVGVVIGIAAVIAMIALGTGARRAVQARIARLGTTLLQVNGTWVRSGGVQQAIRGRLTMDDARAIAERSPHVMAVQVQQDANRPVTYNRYNAYVRIQGVSPNFLFVRKYRMAYGRMFTDAENASRERVAVLGASVPELLGYDVPDAMVGERIRIAGVQFRVIGVMEAKGRTSPFGDPDAIINVPFETGRYRVFGREYLGDIYALATSDADIPQAMAEIASAMRRSHRRRSDQPDDFRIRNQADFLQTMGESTEVFGYLLAGVAAVSLLVGGIGIMNIMLVSVTERTREIGIRKALGATRRTIMLQFLSEAVVLCAAGGVIGVALGVGAAAVLRTAFQWNADVSPVAVVLAFAFAAIVGVLFGVWPARRAASLDPIVALRYE